MVGVRLGIDFGSANLTIVAEGRGVVFCEPSVMVRDASTGRVLAMGSIAKKMLGKLPASMYAVSPIRDGRISDFDAARIMLGSYLEKICGGKLFRPNVLMCVPGTVTEIEKQSLFEVVTSAGAGSACFVGEALAAAIGAGVSLTEPKGVCLCDVGGDVTDIAVVTMGSIAVTHSVKVGGNVFTQAICDYALRSHSVELGAAEAERVMHTVGSAVFRKNEIAVSACGKHLDSGLPVYFEITSTEVYDVLKPYLGMILDGVRAVLEETSPELCADILESGIILTGGAANLYGMDRFIAEETGVKTVRVEDGDKCAAEGIGKLLKNMKYLERNGYVFESAETNDMNEE